MVYFPSFFQFDSLKVVHDAFTSRVDKTRAYIDRVQFELGEEIQITNFINLATACENYLTRHGLALPVCGNR